MKDSITVKVSSRNQISIPSSARKRLNIQPGDQLLVDIQDGMILLSPKPESFTKYMQGLHNDIWLAEETEHYLEAEREAWKD